MARLRAKPDDAGLCALVSVALVTGHAGPPWATTAMATPPRSRISAGLSASTAGNGRVRLMPARMAAVAFDDAGIASALPRRRQRPSTPMGIARRPNVTAPAARSALIVVARFALDTPVQLGLTASNTRVEPAVAW